MAYRCYDCPRNCGKMRDGYAGEGFCGAGEKIAVAKVMDHFGEEPCIGGERGVRNVFLYGCNLKCCYCQNYKINGTRQGLPESVRFYSPEEFGELLVNEAAASECASVGIVTGDHYVRQIAAAITDEVRADVGKPIVFNCSGYAKEETIALLKGKIDIFMPDFKYADSELASGLSRAKDYPGVAEAVVRKCFEMTGPVCFGEDGLLKSGVIVRHLVLPGAVANTIGVIDRINAMFGPGDVVFSLMSQYCPVEGMTVPQCLPSLQRTVTKAEYKKAMSYCDSNENITLVYCQELSSATAKMIPDF